MSRAAPQGIGGAVVDAVSLSLIMALFTASADRAKAMGVYGFVCAGGGSVGVLAGGLLTSQLDWHWIVLLNVPIGAVVFALCLKLLPADAPVERKGGIDVAGAVTVTAALMLATNAALAALVGGLALRPRPAALQAA